MQPKNVIEHATAKWSRLKTNADAEQQHGKAARDLWPVIAADMAALRAMYPSDPMFGAALEEHGIDYSKDDRAAFIWMGSLRPEALRDAMQRCQTRSPDVLRRAVATWGDDYFTSLSELPKEDTDNDINPTSHETAPMAGENTTEPAAECAPEAPAHTAVRIDARSTLTELPHDVAAALYAAIGGDMKHGAKRVIDALIHWRGKGGKKASHAFLAWWAARLNDGTARQPLVKNDHALDATHLVGGLDKSFKNHRQVFYKGAFSKHDAELLVDEFQALREAARDGVTFFEYTRRKNASHAAQALAPAGAFVMPTLAPRAVSAKDLPSEAHFTNGATLHPRPIIVCGGAYYPSDNHPLDYATALLWAHIALRECTTRTMAGQRHEDIGREIATLGTHWVGRQYPEIGRFLSAIGQAIRSRAGATDPAHWFVMEPMPAQTA